MSDNVKRGSTLPPPIEAVYLSAAVTALDRWQLMWRLYEQSGIIGPWANEADESTAQRQLVFRRVLEAVSREVVTVLNRAAAALVEADPKLAAEGS